MDCSVCNSLSVTAVLGVSLLNIMSTSYLFLLVSNMCFSSVETTLVSRMFVFSSVYVLSTQ